MCNEPSWVSGNYAAQVPRPGVGMGVVRGSPRAARVGGPSPRHGVKLRTARLPDTASWRQVVGCVDWGERFHVWADSRESANCSQSPETKNPTEVGSRVELTESGNFDFFTLPLTCNQSYKPKSSQHHGVGASLRNRRVNRQIIHGK